MTAHRNDWRHTILLFGLTGLVESLAFGHLSAFTPLYLRHLNVPDNAVTYWTGMLSALGFVLGLPLLPFWAVWADKYGRKIVIIRSSVFAALIYVCFALAQDVYMLAFARFLGGFVLGNTGVMMAVQADITPRERLGSAVAVISAGSPVGMAVGPYFGGQIIQAFGIRTLFWIDAVLTALVVLALVFLLREEPREFVAPASTRAGVVDALKALTHSPAVVSLFLVTLLLAFGISATMPFLPILVEHLYSGRHLAETIGLVGSVGGICMAIATPIWGVAGDRAGHLRILRLCALVVGLTLVGQAVAGSVEQVAIYRAAMGLCMGGLGALSMVLLAFYAPPDKRSAILTLSLLPQQLAWFVGPLAGSALSFISIRAVFWGGAMSLVAGWLASLRLPPVRDEPVRDE
jgi:MFS transporter, DHA1 family, multidrug resistance protein